MAERDVAQGDPPSTTRIIEGRALVDVPSSGRYTMHAYWTDHRDAPVARNFHIGRGVARVARDKAGLKPQKGAPVERVDVIDGGFGLGSDAVAVVSMPRSTPTFSAEVKNGSVKRVTVLDPGDGCEFDLPLKITANPALPDMRKGRAIARVGSNGQVECVEVTDGGYRLPDNAAVSLDNEDMPVMPHLEPVCKNGSVDRVIVHQPGSNFKEDFEVRFIRRPPIVSIAEASATISKDKQKNRGIESVTVLSRGGWYSTPPIVVAMDVDGPGYGAVLSARLDQAGGVAEIMVIDPGFHYSDNVVIGIYTHQYQSPDQPIPRAILDGERRDSCLVAFTHPIGDLRGRRVDYVMELSSRFRPYLNEALSILEKGPSSAECHSPIWKHVPRLSKPVQIELKSYIRPAKPVVEEMLPAFEWSVRLPQESSIEDADNYFRTHESGHVIIEGSAYIRVYLRRPWNQTGIEHLGVVVMPAFLNTIRQLDPSKPTDKDPNLLKPIEDQDDGVFNPAVTSSKQELGYEREPRENYEIPPEMRSCVSRWGFDPVVNDENFGPLSVDHFESRLEGLTYERIELGEITPGSPLPPPLSTKPAELALFPVSYSGTHERWFADLKLSLRDPNRVKRSLPIVQLALVTYQSHGVPGSRVSPVVPTDHYKMVGERVLDVERRDALRFDIKLSGHFDRTCVKGGFPRRMVTATVRFRDRSLPPEVIGYWPKAKDPTASNRANWATEPYRKIEHQPSSVGEMPPVSFQWAKRGGFYWATVRVEQEMLAKVGRDSGLAISIDEYEDIPALEGRRNFGDDGLVVVDNQLCSRRLVWTYLLEIA